MNPSAPTRMIPIPVTLALISNSSLSGLVEILYTLLYSLNFFFAALSSLRGFSSILPGKPFVCCFFSGRVYREN